MNMEVYESFVNNDFQHKYQIIRKLKNLRCPIYNRRLTLEN